MEDSTLIIYLAVLVVELGATITGMVLFFNKNSNLLPKIVTLGIMSLTAGRFYALLVYWLMDVSVAGFSLAYLGYLAFYLFMCTNYTGIQVISIDHPTDPCAARKKKTLPKILSLIIPFFMFAIAVISCLGGSFNVTFVVTMIIMTFPALFVAYKAMLNAISTSSGWRRTAHLSELIMVVIIHFGVTFMLDETTVTIHALLTVEALLCWVIIVAVRKECKRFE